MRIQNGTSLFVCAKNTNFQSIDLETKEVNWKAKNLPRDDLNLVEKIYHVDSHFTPNGLGYVLSGFNQVLVYDIRAQKKAVDSFAVKMNESGLLSCFTFFDEHQLAIGNNMGSIGVFDVRSKNKMMKCMNDNIGGITSLQRVSENPEDVKFVSG